MKFTYVFCFLCLFLMVACGPSKKTTSASRAKHQTQEPVRKVVQTPSEHSNRAQDHPKTNEVKDLSKLNAVELYIYNYAGIAQEEMRLYGIPASITIAQGILESGSGNGNLTRRSNNHFGIKCNGWEGEKVYHDDDEAQECFRKYVDAKYSFRDHSLFLFERSRYSFLFDYNSDDYKAWARGLRSAGYATDPRYPKKLISLIERYQLHQYDLEVLGKTADTPLPKPERLSLGDTDFYRVKKGDTLYNISQRFNLTVEELKLINKLRNDHINVGQELKVKN